ncbi:MAG TPA: PAS domain-containing protein [Beijerinckiaceae bacterium]|jgi:PAS domain S-box-containing protein
MSRKVAKLATNYLDLSLDCAALLLPSGSLEYLNPAAVKAFKLDGPRAHPSWAELWETSPERDRARAALHRAAAGESASFRAWLHMAGEEPRFLDTLLTPLGSAPEDARILAVSRDLTEAKLYAAALEDKSERYHLAAKATRDAIWDWDLITDQIDWGEATKETFGPEAGPDAGSVNWWKANLHPEDRDRVLTRLRDFLAGPDACWSDEYRFRDSSGGYREVVDRGYVVRDRHGAPVRMVGAMTDLSSLRRAEEELATLSARLKTMFETTTDGIVALDPSWRLQFMNKRAEELLRLRADDVGEDLWTLFPDLATSEFGRAFRAAMEDDGPSDLTAYYAPFSLWFTCRLFPSSDGLTVFFRDITRLKTYQRTIKSSEERLKMALKAGRVVTWERNEDSDVLRFSDNAEDILGFRTCTLQQFRTGPMSRISIAPGRPSVRARPGASASSAHATSRSGSARPPPSSSRMKRASSWARSAT